jgi:hypothetical protein
MTVEELRELLKGYPDHFKIRMSIEGTFPVAYLIIRDGAGQEIDTIKFEKDIDQ